MLTGSLFSPLPFKIWTKESIEQCVCLMAYSITLAVVFVGFHKIFVKSFRKLIFTELYTCFFQTLAYFQMTLHFSGQWGKEVIEQPLFLTKDIRI